MPEWLIALVAGDVVVADPLAHAEARFRALESYRVTLCSWAVDGHRQVIRYAWHRHGWVRMDFLELHRIAVMIYDPRHGPCAAVSLIETVDMNDAELDIPFPEHFFTP
ncbi:hypothetical protein [Aromatoleum aromaticum]|uniref:hypothetical protein n=1 Tax=Aromatoleum aromaticum TaxID=551760 RepID=UPI0002F9D818|nr:hypothetical protein [Aromatoleum aromaticum]NMG53320.1 hypothetical protein [Aromatoleum aromaticum]